MTRRQFLLASAAAALCPTAAVAATKFPAKAVRIVVPNAPGGAADITARAVGEHMARTLGQPVVIDNRPGAGGVVAHLSLEQLKDAVARDLEELLNTRMALPAGALGAVGVAQARDVYWSVGVGSPGVSVGVGNVPPAYYGPAPVYVQPAPVYVAPRPVYVRPRPVYVQPPAYYAPPRVVYRPAPVYYGPPGHWHKKPRKHRRHRGWDD